jgi:INO80 complex subunit Ies4
LRVRVANRCSFLFCDFDYLVSIVSISSIVQNTMDPSSPTDLPDYSRSHMSKLVRLKLPPRALAAASSADAILPDTRGHVASPVPPSSPPTMASSPAPGAAPPAKKRRGQKSKHAIAPGSGVFSINHDGGGSGAGTPVPGAEKERAKPGPKANPGGINAGLRALDRSGRATRRWQKVKYPVTTLAGYTFHATTWISPPGNDAQVEGLADFVVPDTAHLVSHRPRMEGGDDRWGTDQDDGDDLVGLGHMDEAATVTA